MPASDLGGFPEEVKSALTLKDRGQNAGPGALDRALHALGATIQLQACCFITGRPG